MWLSANNSTSPAFNHAHSTTSRLPFPISMNHDPHSTNGYKPTQPSAGGFSHTLATNASSAVQMFNEVHWALNHTPPGLQAPNSSPAWTATPTLSSSSSTSLSTPQTSLNSPWTGGSNVNNMLSVAATPSWPTPNNNATIPTWSGGLGSGSTWQGAGMPVPPNHNTYTNSTTPGLAAHPFGSTSMPSASSYIQQPPAPTPTPVLPQQNLFTLAPPRMIFTPGQQWGQPSAIPQAQGPPAPPPVPRQAGSGSGRSGGRYHPYQSRSASMHQHNSGSSNFNHGAPPPRAPSYGSYLAPPNSATAAQGFGYNHHRQHPTTQQSVTDQHQQHQQSTSSAQWSTGMDFHRRGVPNSNFNVGAPGPVWQGLGPQQQTNPPPPPASSGLAPMNEIRMEGVRSTLYESGGGGVGPTRTQKTRSNNLPSVGASIWSMSSQEKSSGKLPEPVGNGLWPEFNPAKNPGVVQDAPNSASRACPDVRSSHNNHASFGFGGAPNTMMPPTSYGQFFSSHRDQKSNARRILQDSFLHQMFATRPMQS